MTLSDISEHVWQFDYDPEGDWVDVERVPPTLPVTVHLEDEQGNIVDAKITTFALPEKWMLPFLQ